MEKQQPKQQPTNYYDDYAESKDNPRLRIFGPIGKGKHIWYSVDIGDLRVLMSRERLRELGLTINRHFMQSGQLDLVDEVMEESVKAMENGRRR